MSRSQRYQAIAAYYDAEHARTRMLQEDVPFFLGQLPDRPQHILELAVGTGRAAIVLAESGHRVVGVDNDAKMLAIAAAKRTAAGLGERQLRLLRADALKLHLRERFDWVCIFFNTFCNFTTVVEQDRLLQVCRSHLKPRGRLWIDIFHPDFELLAHKRQSNLEPAAFYVPEMDRTVFSTTALEVFPASQRQRVTMHYTWFDSFGQESRQRVQFDLTWFLPREMRLLLERNGFAVEQMYGNYDGSDLRDSSPRMICRCRLRVGIDGLRSKMPTQKEP